MHLSVAQEVLFTWMLGRLKQRGLIGRRTDQLVALRQHRMHRQKLKLIDAALERLENGEFGVCAECGEPIPAKQLNIVSWAALTGPVPPLSRVVHRSVSPVTWVGIFRPAVTLEPTDGCGGAPRAMGQALISCRAPLAQSALQVQLSGSALTSFEGLQLGRFTRT